MKNKTRDYAAVLRQEIANDPELRAIAEQDNFDTNIAVQIYEARKRANLTQDQLAKKIGTKSNAISRMEDAAYRGHSIRILRKIADALDCTIGMEFYPRIKIPESDVVTTTTITTSIKIQTQQVANVQISGVAKNRPMSGATS